MCEMIKDVQNLGKYIFSKQEILGWPSCTEKRPIVKVEGVEKDICEDIIV